MNEKELKEIYEELQKSPFNCINSKREIRSFKKTSLSCCNFEANYANDFIGYDPKMLEFLDKYPLRWSLLHEEGHMRFFLEKLDYDDNLINDPTINSVEKYRYSEINADLYAAKQLLKHFPEIKAYDLIEPVMFANCQCNPKSFFCFLKKWIKKVCNAIYFMSLQSPYPTVKERIQYTKNYYEKMNSDSIIQEYTREYPHSENNPSKSINE